MEAGFGKGLAGLEMEIVDDEVGFGGSGPGGERSFLRGGRS